MISLQQTQIRELAGGVAEPKCARMTSASTRLPRRMFMPRTSGVIFLLVAAMVTHAVSPAAAQTGVVNLAPSGEAARGPAHRDASPTHALWRGSSAAWPAALNPTSDTTRGIPRAWRRTRIATGPARSGIHAAYEAPRRHTMPSAQAAGKRGSGPGRTSVSQSVGTTGHFFRLHLRPWCPGRGHNRRIL